MKALHFATCLCLALAGCAPASQVHGAKEEAANWQRLSAEPTPKAWASGSKWRFTVADNGKPVQEVTFVVTDEPAEACMSGEWKRLNVVGGSSLQLNRPAYSASGRNLQILLSTDLCDAYNMLVGAMQENSFAGVHRFTGLGGGKDLGPVNGKALDLPR